MDPEQCSFLISAFSPASSPEPDLNLGAQKVLNTETSMYEMGGFNDKTTVDGRRDSAFTISASTNSSTTPADPLPSIIEPLLEPTAVSPLETPTYITTCTAPANMLNPASTAINTIEEPTDATFPGFTSAGRITDFLDAEGESIQLTTPTNAAVAPDLPTIPETSTIDNYDPIPAAEERPSAREVCFCVSAEEWQRKKEEQLASWAAQTGQAIGGIGIGLERERCMHVLAERISGSTERRASLGLIVLDEDGL